MTVGSSSEEDSGEESGAETGDEQDEEEEQEDNEGTSFLISGKSVEEVKHHLPYTPTLTIMYMFYTGMSDRTRSF